jgi:hypothetical protein
MSIIGQRFQTSGILFVEITTVDIKPRKRRTNVCIQSEKRECGAVAVG